MDDENKPLVRDPLSPTPPSKHPFQFWVMMACVVNGWVVLINDPQTQFRLVVSPFTSTLWGLLLILGGSCCILSAWWPDRITGLLIERVSLSALGIATFVYGSILWDEYGTIATFPVALSFGASLASFWRVRHVNREIAVLVRLVNARHRLLAHIEDLNVEAEEREGDEE